MPAVAAIPLIVSFAEAAGIVVSGVATAAGIDILSNKVEKYIEENPEQSQKIFDMIMPAQGLANILKNESSEGDEEVSETDVEVAVEEKPRLTGKEKGMRIREAIRRARGEKGLPARGNYSSPDAEGPAVDIGGSVIREVEDMGIADKDLKDNYDPNKKKFDYKKFYRRRKMDGGMMEYANGGGIGSMMERKSFKGGGMDMGNASNQKQSAASANTTSKSSTNKGPAGGQSTGGNYNGGNNNKILNRIIEKNKPGKSPFAKFVDHDNFTDTIKLAETPNYHQLGGLDFMKRFPNTNPSLAKGLAKGYQYLSEGAKALTNEDVSFADAMKRAKEETRLNIIGINDSANPESATYTQYQELVPETGKVVFANGGGVGSMMQRKSFKGPKVPAAPSQLVSKSDILLGYRGDAAYRSKSEQSKSIGQGNVGSKASFGGGQGTDSSGKSEGAGGVNPNQYTSKQQDINNIKAQLGIKDPNLLQKTFNKYNSLSLPVKAGINTIVPAEFMKIFQAGNVLNTGYNQIIRPILTEEDITLEPGTTLPDLALGATEEISFEGNSPFMRNQINERIIAAENKYYEQGKMPPEFLGDKIRMNMELGNYKGYMGPGFEDGGRVNYNQGSNWWDTLNDQGMNVYNSMKRGGHDDATIQSQLAMLGYYDPNSAQPDPTPDPTPTVGQNQGGDNFSPYNPNPNTLKNFNENYNLNFNKKNNQQLSTLRDSIRANSALNEMNIDNPFSGEIQSIENMGYDDMMPNITTANQQNVEEEEGLAALARKKFGNILSFVGGLAIPGLGPLKSGLNAIGNTLPTNKRYIMENELMGSGFNINDIGQIVSDGGDYDDPSGKNVMAGYNAYKVNADTFAKRRAMINAKMSPKNKVKRLAALDAAEKIFNDSKKISNAVIKQKDNNQGNGGNGGGGGGGFNSDNSTGYDSGNFCFDPSTPIQMFDGSTKEIKNIQLGDSTKGGEVTGVFQFKATDEIHDYKGVTVAGSHYVKEDGKFIMVKDSPLSVKIDKIPVVYSLDTTGRRIFINDIEFSDYNGDGVAKNFLSNAGVDLSGFNKEVLRQVENRLI